jgi:hypothetical protein
MNKFKVRLLTLFVDTISLAQRKQVVFENGTTGKLFPINWFWGFRSIHEGLLISKGKY